MINRQLLRLETILPITLAACAILVLPACNKQPPAPEPERAAAPVSVMPEATPGDHVSFFVLGKTWHFQQDSTGLHGPNDIHYFAEVFRKAGGQVSDASMRLLAPGAEPIPFDHESDDGAVLHAREGKVHLDVADLDAELPNGDYGFSFHTPAGDVTDFPVSIGSANSVTDLPPPPEIQLSQEGKPVDPEVVQAGQDLRISWTPFASGRADPNGIADDLIFVMMEDCRGERVYHSGRPLDTPNPMTDPTRPSAGWLTYAATETTVPGTQLTPGMGYRLEVEIAHLVDTDRRQGVVGMTTLAATTHLNIETVGEAPAGGCPNPDET